MLQFALKIILCDFISCLDLIHTNACTVFKNESQVVALFIFPFSKTLLIQRKMGGTAKPTVEVEVGKPGLLGRAGYGERRL